MSALQASAQRQLRQYIEQIERLEEEKKGLGADIRDKFAEAKGQGFDVPTMKRVLKVRRMSKAERQESDDLLDVYLHALEGTPLGDWAIRQDGDAAQTS